MKRRTHGTVEVTAKRRIRIQSGVWERHRLIYVEDGPAGAAERGEGTERRFFVFFGAEKAREVAAAILQAADELEADRRWRRPAE